MRPLVISFLLVFCLGCPGQRRPNPALTTSAGTEPAAEVRPEGGPAPAEPAPAVGEVPLAGPADRLRQLEADLERIDLPPGPLTAAQWRDGLARLDGLQTRGFALQEVEDEDVLDRLYPLLERLEDLRAGWVGRQPN